jgi:hypothetical protein
VFGNWTATTGPEWNDAEEEGDLTQFAGHMSAAPLYTDPEDGDYTLSPAPPPSTPGTPPSWTSTARSATSGPMAGPTPTCSPLKPHPT